jgi:hypothetical protein
MNPRTYKKMLKINQRLEEYHQKTRINYLTSTSATLNSGVTLYGNQAIKFIKRVMNEKIIDWVKNIDKILSGEIKESDIKKICLSMGGKACQKKHKDKIRQNLNTGTPWNKNKKGCQVGWAKGLTKEIDARIEKFSKSGEKNPMFGKHLTEDHKTKLSKAMRLKILNGEFTPNTNNRNTHWKATLDGVPYRSSWEAFYKYINPDANYESLRIQYNHETQNKIYIVDFIDYKNKLVVEVKPKELCVGLKFKSKLSALTEWANQNFFSVLIVDKEWFQSQQLVIDFTRFDQNTILKIKKLYETR